MNVRCSCCFKGPYLFLFFFKFLFHLLDSFRESINQDFSLLFLVNLLMNCFFFFIFVVVKTILNGKDVFIDGNTITEKLFQLIDLAMFCLVFFLKQLELHFKVMNLILKSFNVLIFDWLFVGAVFEVLDFVGKEGWFGGGCHVKALDFFLWINGWRGRNVDSIETLELREGWVLFHIDGEAINNNWMYFENGIKFDNMKRMININSFNTNPIIIMHIHLYNLVYELYSC